MNDIVYVGKHSLTKYVSRHAHADWEIIYCTGGAGELRFSGTVISYRAGDLIVIPPMLPHINSSADGFTNIFLNISDCTLLQSEPTLISNPCNDNILGVFASAFCFFSSEESPNLELLSAFGNLIVAYISSYHPDVEKNDLSRKIKREILHNFTDSSFDLGAYLHGLPFSYDYIIKLFKTDFGETPHRYLNQLRLRSAAKLLKAGSGNNITEISFMSGFKDSLYFSRLFKKYYGVSPTAYGQTEKTQLPTDAESLKICIE